MANPFSALVAMAVVLANPAGAIAAQEPGAPVLPRVPARNEDIVIVTPAGGNSKILLRTREAEPDGLPSLPFFANLLEWASPRAFGSDHRCEVVQAGRKLTLRCRPGTSMSGALMAFPRHRLPAGASTAWQITSVASPGFRAEVTLEGEDASALQDVPTGTVSLPVPDRSDTRAPQLVIVAPPEGGTLELTHLELTATKDRPVNGFSAWAWEPTLWSDNPEALIASARKRQVERLFVTLETSDGKIARERDLRRFVRLATAAGIGVEAVEGDPRMVLPAGLEAALVRARAFAAYQKTAAAGEALAGIQYDIEPYTLEEWGQEPAGYLGWAEAVTRLAAAAGAPVDLVLPFWLPTSDEGRAFLARVEPAVRAVTVMSYRTQASLLAQVAEPFLAWGVRHEKPVRLALEAGPIADEVEEIYREAAVGTLAVWEGPAPRLVFLDQPGVRAGAKMFARQQVHTIPGSRISFLGDEPRLFETAKTTAPAFSAWPTFAGFAVHGLRWDDGEEPLSSGL